LRLRKLITILLILELLVAYFVVAPSVHRREHTRAFVAWHDNPTLETRAELDRQSRINQFYSVGFSGVVFLIMAVTTLFAAHRWRLKHPIQSDLR
jgi:hypothetical protein